MHSLDSILTLAPAIIQASRVYSNIRGINKPELSGLIHRNYLSLVYSTKSYLVQLKKLTLRK